MNEEYFELFYTKFPILRTAEFSKVQKALKGFKIYFSIVKEWDSGAKFPPVILCSSFLQQFCTIYVKDNNYILKLIKILR